MSLLINGETIAGFKINVQCYLLSEELVDCLYRDSEELRAIYADRVIKAANKITVFRPEPEEMSFGPRN